MNASDVRKAHKLLDYVSQGRAVLDDELKLLRSFLPELPKQKTLEEITEHVCDAWTVASGIDWGGNSYAAVSIDDWLWELYEQLQGLKDTPVAVPALPEGFRLADHEQYGRVITSPKPNRDGIYDLLVPKPTFETGADWEYAHECELMFIDAAPAAPAHPEFLETEADYENAPEGTIVARDSINPWVKEESVWVQGSAADATVYTVPCLKGPRRILRWGWQRMSNFDRAVKALNDVDEAIDHLADNEAYVAALEAAGLLAPDVQVIRTLEELEALAWDDADAIVLVSEAGVVRSVKALWEMYSTGDVWGLTAVVVASGSQVRAAREAMEQDNE